MRKCAALLVDGLPRGGTWVGDSMNLAVGLGLYAIALVGLAWIMHLEEVDAAKN